MNVKAFHDSTKLRFREPFGALRCGESAVLRLFVWGDGAEEARAVLRIWSGGERFTEGASRFELGAKVFEFNVTAPDAPGMIWYNFRVVCGGKLYYVGAADAKLRSGASEFTEELPHDFRITVYDKDFTAPGAFAGRIAYQIFPDRFARGEYPGLAAGIAHHRALGRRVTEKAWDEEVDFLPRDREKYYSPQDYYMGNFQGIIDRIPYLKSLGVEVLYLNPVFESAYNHRYSISDYMKIDPLLGTEEDFSRMAAALRENGIALILDGVFSHTGDDSIYFDRYGNYGGGAYSDPASPYREWFDFSPRYRHGFRCWWDFESLPEVEELTPSYMEFVGNVLEKWVRLGARGWRLDVADELPDEFIKYLRKRLKAIDPEALLIGEVWEDAVLKRDCFGKRRDYVNGTELDGVMDYPFRDAVMDHLLGRISSERLGALLTAQLEGYPKPFMRSQLGLIGSHDTERALSVLSGGPVKSGLPREKQAVWKPESAAAERGKKRLKLAACLQFAMPFMPCIYYGDEAGLTGLADPFSRRPYPWGHEDAELLAFFRRLAGVRSERPEFRLGDTSFICPGPDLFAVERAHGDLVSVVIVNRSEREAAFPLCSRFRMGEGESRPLPRGLILRDAFTGERFLCGGELEVPAGAFGFRVLVSEPR